jgi:hypothetical protein
MTPWITTEEADVYFATRMGADVYWLSGTDKEAALVTAQRDLESCGLFTFPTLDSGESGTEAMQNAVCEQALFRLMDPDIDQRLSLQAQGVTKADMVGETYSGVKSAIIISPLAAAILVALVTTGVSGIPWER